MWSMAGEPEPDALGADRVPDVVETEPDYRFTLANERTFLAWIRTALALIGSGVVIGTAVNVDPSWLRAPVAVTPIVLGVAGSTIGYLRWRSNERAFRAGRPIETNHALAYVAIAVTLSGLVAAIVVLATIVTSS
jgi:putative membrane protein